jgi:hypothetical protein
MIQEGPLRFYIVCGINNEVTDEFQFQMER